MTRVSEAQSLKQRQERSIFHRFCSSAGIEIRLGSLTQPDPPDILAEVVGEGRVGFELVRLNDPSELQAFSLFPAAKGIIEASFWKLAVSRRDALREQHRLSVVSVGFAEVYGKAARQEAMAAVWSILSLLPAGFSGSVALRAWGAPPPLSSLHVTQSVVPMDDGPWFQAIGSGGAYPLRVEQIGKKLQTPYGRSYPLELLAYVERGEIQFEGAAERIRDEVRSALPGSHFRAVWVFECMHDRAWRVNPAAA